VGIEVMRSQLFESVAIDPAVARNQLVCMILKHKFGLSNGRFIAGVPRDWINFALQQINSVADENLKRKLKEILRSIDQSGAMVPDSVSFDRTRPWIQAISSESVKKVFDVLVTDEISEFNPLYSSDNIDEYIENSEERVGYLDVSTLREAREFIPVLDPFLKKHKKIVLVNRHQWLMSTRKERDLFETVFQHWALLGGVDFTVVRSSIEKHDDPRPFRANWRHEQELLIKYFNRIRFAGTFRFVAVNDERNRLHHRYLLGNYCGLSMDYGFEMVNKPHPWQLLNRAHFSDAKEKFFIGDVLALYPESESFCYSLRGKRVSGY
jgi:hypothetical protein